MENLEIGLMAHAIRDYQEINYPVLWGGHLVRPFVRAVETPTPQEKLYIFLFGSPLHLGLTFFELSYL
ncbi:hypothetical protein NIES25_22510 [Nostoc linckia NIES-25]|nr:hypothetical protein NIES25_22510 [Nostoc linckia NIES-25]